MVSIILNETRGKLIQVGEGDLENAPLSYYFNKNVDKKKASYNTLTKFNVHYLLNDSSVFKNRYYRTNLEYPSIIDRTDVKWKGEYWPISNSTPPLKEPTQPKINDKYTLLAECDFYKFRGRGPVQVTGRGNYAKSLKFLKDNQNELGLNQDVKDILNSYGNFKYGNKPEKDKTDVDLSRITNDQLDTIYNDPKAARTVFNHDSIAALKKVGTATTIEDFLTKAYAYGLAVSGGDVYASLYVNRVAEMTSEILKNDIFKTTTLIGRRIVNFTEDYYQKGIQKVIDFDKMSENEDAFKNLDVLYCCLGTTRGKSGAVFKFYFRNSFYELKKLL
jgi:hypothetical protein